MKWVGLTGGIATGKSTVKKLIEGLGHPVIDADLISHQLTQINAAGYVQIVAQFSHEILNSDASIDRKKLGQFVFNNPEQLKKLEAILHPLIKIEVEKQKKRYLESQVKLCFYDVPLLFEKKLESNFDAILLIWCDLNTQKARLLARDQFTDEEVEARLSSQLKMAYKVKNSDHCIDNSTHISNLEIQVNNLIHSIV